MSQTGTLKDTVTKPGCTELSTNNFHNYCLLQ